MYSDNCWAEDLRYVSGSMLLVYMWLGVVGLPALPYTLRYSTEGVTNTKAIFSWTSLYQHLYNLSFT